MRQNLFFIPHSLVDVVGIPGIGLGWLFFVWLAASIGVAFYLIRHGGFDAETRSQLTLLGIIGLGIVVMLPMLEMHHLGQPVGVPIRGFGVMLLVAVCGAVALAVKLGRRVGIVPDLIFAFAMWLVVGGIVGARLFFIVQYWEQFQRTSLVGTLVAIAGVTNGGLVVYGSLIGASAAAWIFARRHRLPLFALADLIAPSMMLGLALGRIGCFLNGCCFGGLCALPWAVTFPMADPPIRPHDSPPYAQQRRLGLLHGIRVDGDEQGRPIVSAIVPPRGTVAGERGLAVGDKIVAVNGVRINSAQTVQDLSLGGLPTRSDGQVDRVVVVRSLLQQSGPDIELTTAEGLTVRWSAVERPGTDWSRSLPVHPTQIYSAINAMLICVLLWFYYPRRRRDGQVIALLLTIYPVARFLLEMIRTDESAIGATGLTISQNVSLAILVAAVAFWAYLLRQPPKIAFAGSSSADTK